MVVVDYKKKPTPEKNIKKIVEYLRKNKELLTIVKYLVSSEIFRGTGQFDDSLDEQLELIEMEVLVSEKEFKFKEITYLVEMWKKITKTDMGYLLEYLLEMLGPYNIVSEYDFTREAKIEGLESHNYDIIFFRKTCEINEGNKQKVSVIGQAEFHECKRNVNSFIPDVTKGQEIRSNNKRKLNFMKKTYNKDQSNFNIYITSLINNKRVQTKYLKENGYGFIQILSVLDLIH